MKEIKELEDIRKCADAELVELKRALKLIRDIEFISYDVIQQLRFFPCRNKQELKEVLEDLEKHIRRLEEYNKKAFIEERGAFKLENTIRKLVERANRDIAHYENKLKTF
ncbi:MAG: hypothetical protein JSW73_05545 [Candidatus Woesearchaeota archaeon]|nr:MAG: hypothetical protein JSW73_05545 [Candidatus Woesearchaeota archaeon]